MRIKFSIAMIFTFLLVTIMIFQIVSERFDLTTLGLVIVAMLLMAAILTILERK